MKKKTKQELQQQITKIDPLEIVVEEICRSESASAKRSKQNEFASKTATFIADERDVLLIAIKIR